MTTGAGDGNRPIYPFGQSVEQMSLSKDLSGFDKKIGDGEYKTTIRKSFATLTVFMNSEQADAWVELIMRAYETGRWKEYDFLVMWAHSRVSIEGRGREDVLKAIAQLYWIKEQQGDHADTRKSARRSNQQYV